MARAFGGQDKTVVWSHLDENEQSKWMDFLLDNNVQVRARLAICACRAHAVIMGKRCMKTPNL